MFHECMFWESLGVQTGSITENQQVVLIIHKSVHLSTYPSAFFVCLSPSLGQPSISSHKAVPGCASLRASAWGALGTPTACAHFELWVIQIPPEIRIWKNSEWTTELSGWGIFWVIERPQKLIAIQPDGHSESSPTLLEGIQQMFLFPPKLSFMLNGLTPTIPHSQIHNLL